MFALFQTICRAELSIFVLLSHYSNSLSQAVIQYLTRTIYLKHEVAIGFVCEPCFGIRDKEPGEVTQTPETFVAKWNMRLKNRNFQNDILLGLCHFIDKRRGARSVTFLK